MESISQLGLILALVAAMAINTALFVTIFARLITMKQSIKSVKEKMITGSSQKVLMERLTINEDNINRKDLKIEGLQESITSLGNKVTSRLRIMSKEEKAAQAEPVQEYDEPTVDDEMLQAALAKQNGEYPPVENYPQEEMFPKSQRRSRGR